MSDSSAVTANGRAAARERKLSFRGGGFVIEQRTWISVLGFVGLIGLWQLVTGSGLVSPIFLPSPMRVLRALWDLAVTGDLWRHVSASLMRIGWGWLIGTLFGVAFGLMIGLFTVSRAVGLPLVAALFPIPKIALLPLFILWFGIGESSKVATIALGVFFPTVISAYSAVDNVPRNLIRMGQSFGLPAASIVAKIILPGAMPGILAGFRISSSIALILVVAAEMIGAEYGIGAFILAAGNLMQTDQLVAGVVVLSLLGLAISVVLGRIERRVLRWR
jgi:NitT/TauT family transport system permease protein